MLLIGGLSESMDPAFTDLEEWFFAEGDAMSGIPEEIAEEPTTRFLSGRGLLVVEDTDGYYAAIQIGLDEYSGELSLPEIAFEVAA